jgi:hypothetical protein
MYSSTRALAVAASRAIEIMKNTPTEILFFLKTPSMDQPIKEQPSSVKREGKERKERK